jgi:hypothetical protein
MRSKLLTVLLLIPIAASCGKKTPTSPTTTTTTTTTPTQAPPTVDVLDPASGSVDGGTLVTITGTGFTNVGGVTFGGVAALSYTVVSDTVITAITPAVALSALDVAVKTAGGTSAVTSADVFTANANSLTDLSLSVSDVASGKPVRGSIAVTYPAPPNGLRLKLGVTATPAVPVVVLAPATVIIPEGATSASFQITTLYVSAPARIDLAAEHWGAKSASFTIEP